MSNAADFMTYVYADSSGEIFHGVYSSRVRRASGAGPEIR